MRASIRFILLLPVFLSGLTAHLAATGALELQPIAWTPAPAPKLEGPLAPNAALEGARPLATGLGGPESISFGPDGRIYTGTGRGDIVSIDPGTGAVRLVAHTGEQLDACGQEDLELEQRCGRPLGNRFDADGNLIVADGYKGLLKARCPPPATSSPTTSRGRRTTSGRPTTAATGSPWGRSGAG